MAEHLESLTPQELVRIILPRLILSGTNQAHEALRELEKRASRTPGEEN